ncbi:hypothetical protein C8R44DRAFT_732809 [Mycena epipterygia]|nr:hypothetical protein C8R44DRAFT_732809 [Mycena epipterygia]
MNHVFNQVLRNTKDVQMRTALKRYLGISAGIGGLRQVFDVLKRKGLISQSTKGPFWHNLDEALHHFSQVQFHETWLDIGKASWLNSYECMPPEKLNKIDRMESEMYDQVYRQWTMVNMDILPYLALRTALKSADVGRIEDLLLSLLFQCAGGGNPKCAIEISELFQREWPEKLRMGGENSWLPFDLGQLQLNGPGSNNGVYGQGFSGNPGFTEGPETYGKIIPNNCAGAQHGVPDKENDVAQLTTHYTSSKLQTIQNGQKLKREKAVDVVTEGGGRTREKRERIGRRRIKILFFSSLYCLL